MPFSNINDNNILQQNTSTGRYISHSNRSFSSQSLMQNALTWMRDINTSTHDASISFHSPPSHPWWQASIWTDCTSPPGTGPVWSACERTGWAANNSALNNEQEFCGRVSTRRGEQRDTRTVVMMGAPSSVQFRMNSRSSSILTCWMSLLRFSSDVPDSRGLDVRGEKSRWSFESSGPHFFNDNVFRPGLD